LDYVVEILAGGPSDNGGAGYSSRFNFHLSSLP